ncbi:MAG: tautomerase family protein [Salinivirgaceae bacterium]|nr:tautomerase family protein [Salinivirgaceae bacterium]
MPAITIQSIELRDEQKEIIAEKFTALFSELTNVPQDRIYVFFDGYSLNSVAKGNELFAKNPPINLIAKYNQNK